MSHRFGLGRAALVVSLVVLAAPAAAAGAPPQFVIGPVNVRHGYEVFASSNGRCRSPGPPSLLKSQPGVATVEFIKAIPGGVEVHSYRNGNPTKATCNLSSGVFKLSLGRMGTIDVKFHPGSVKPRKSRVIGVATGTFKLDIDPSYFGRVDLHRLRGSIGTASPSGDTQFVELLGYFGPYVGSPLLVGAAFPDGRSALMIQAGARTANRTVVGTHTIYLTGGPTLFGSAPDLTSATINGPGGRVTGQLRFSNPQRAYSGTLSGALNVRFDVIGTRILQGSTVNNPGPELFRCAGTGCPPV